MTVVLTDTRSLDCPESSRSVILYSHWTIHLAHYVYSEQYFDQLLRANRAVPANEWYHDLTGKQAPRRVV
jgi:hypothetical protein